MQKGGRNRFRIKVMSELSESAGMFCDCLKAIRRGLRYICFTTLYFMLGKTSNYSHLIKQFHKKILYSQLLSQSQEHCYIQYADKNISRLKEN